MFEIILFMKINKNYKNKCMHFIPVFNQNKTVWINLLVMISLINGIALTGWYMAFDVLSKLCGRFVHAPST